MTLVDRGGVLEQSEELKHTLTHVEKLLDRRQTTTSFYLSVNTAIVAVIGLLLKDTQLAVKWLTFRSAPSVCRFHRLLDLAFFLRQYEILLEWWYARLRELEALKPDSAQLVTREYEDLYVATFDRIGTASVVADQSRDMVVPSSVSMRHLCLMASRIVCHQLPGRCDDRTTAEKRVCVTVVTLAS